MRRNIIKITVTKVYKNISKNKKLYHLLLCLSSEIVLLIFIYGSCIKTIEINLKDALVSPSQGNSMTCEFVKTK